MTVVPRHWRRFLGGAVVVVSITGLSTCGDGGGAPVTSPIAPSALDVPADLLPEGLNGLRVAEEDITAQQAEMGARSYLASVRMWSLREGERLRATLQVGRFVRDDFPVGDEVEREAFQKRIVSQIGQGGVRERVVDARRVYVSISNELPLFIWFDHDAFFVLSAAKDYGRPRSLLRAALAIRMQG